MGLNITSPVTAAGRWSGDFRWTRSTWFCGTSIFPGVTGADRLEFRVRTSTYMCLYSGKCVILRIVSFFVFKALLGRFRTSTNTITITNTSSIIFQINIMRHRICKREMPTYRSKSTKSCSFGTSRTCLNEMARDDVMIWTHVPTKWWRVRYRFRTGAKPYKILTDAWLFLIAIALVKKKTKREETEDIWWNEKYSFYCSNYKLLCHGSVRTIGVKVINSGETCHAIV
jgi:hypothetical protein